MKDWGTIYRTSCPVQTEPSRKIVDTVPILRGNNVCNILDHGCGTGRHVKYLAMEGFYVVGTEPFDDALRYAQELVSGMRNVGLVKADMDSIPISDGYFDATISNHVVQHARRVKREGAFHEMERTLRPQGLLLLTTVSRSHKAYGTGRQIEPHTFIDLPDMPDGKTPHHYFSEGELRGYLGGFEILSLEHHSSPPDKDGFFKLGNEEWLVLARKR